MLVKLVPVIVMMLPPLVDVSVSTVTGGEVMEVAEEIDKLGVWLGVEGAVESEGTVEI